MPMDKMKYAVQIAEEAYANGPLPLGNERDRLERETYLSGKFEAKYAWVGKQKNEFNSERSEVGHGVQ